MKREEVLAELKEAITQRDSHNEDRDGRHLGCPPGSACDGYIDLSDKAAMWLLRNLDCPAGCPYSMDDECLAHSTLEVERDG